LVVINDNEPNPPLLNDWVVLVFVVFVAFIFVGG